MKIAIFRPLLLSFITASLFISCKKKEEIYSCNPDLNKWVIANKAQYSNTNRMELCKLRSDSMFAILNSISPETKLKLWKEKMAIVMKKQFTSIERQHLIALLDRLSLDIYTDSVQNKEFNEYAEKWWKEAHTLLKWDDKKIFLLTNTLYTEAEFPLHDVLREGGDITLEPGDHITPPYKDPDCTCRYSFSCSQGSCIDGTCGYQPANCGVFGGSRCTGRCQ